MKKALACLLCLLVLAPEALLAQTVEFKAAPDAAIPDFSALAPSLAAAAGPDMSALAAQALDFRDLGAAGPATRALEEARPATAAAPGRAIPARSAAAPGRAHRAAERPGATPHKEIALRRWQYLARLRKLFERHGIMNQKAAQDRFWSGAGPAQSEGAVAEAGTSQEPNDSENFRLHAAMTPALAGTSALAHWTPYLGAGAAVAGTYAAGRLARRAVEKAGRKSGWPADKISLYRTLASAAVWSAGGVIVLHLLGASLNHMVASAGVIGALISIVSGDLVNNMLEAGRVLFGRPFSLGDRIKVGGQAYTVADFGLHDLVLAGDDGSETVMPYTSLTSSPITVPPEAVRQNAAEPSPRPAWRAAFADFLRARSPERTRRLLWGAASYLSAAAATYLRLAGAAPGLGGFFPLLHCATILAATFTTSGLIKSVIARLAERSRWHPRKALLLRLALEAAVMILGGGLALKALGTSWAALGASLGFVSIGLGLVTQSVFSSVWRWFLIRFGRIFGFDCSFEIGDRISSGGIKGVVSDLNFYYVVLRQEDGSNSYVHYSIAFPFVRLSPPPAGAHAH